MENYRSLYNATTGLCYLLYKLDIKSARHLSRPPSFRKLL